MEKASCGGIFSKLEKTKHLIEAHSMLHIANKDLCST